ncbi:MAG: hypothetical protein H0V17_05075, partial [Deltaproteobacteria bacterium]|nr:hypothetical protein [Deltaproteobacteria bacterium]
MRLAWPMLVLGSMKIAKLSLCSLLLAAAATPALAGPDFSTPSPRGTELTASPATRDMLPSDDVIFAHDSATLTESAQAQLDTIARYLSTRRGLQLVVEG